MTAETHDLSGPLPRGYLPQGCIDPSRPAADIQLLQSGQEYWFETFETLVQGRITVLNDVDGFPAYIYPTEPDVIEELMSESCIANEDPEIWGSCRCLDCNDEIGWANNTDFLFGRKAIWHPNGGWIEGDRLPVPAERRA
jgi:hypothetical protein